MKTAILIGGMRVIKVDGKRTSPSCSCLKCTQRNRPVMGWGVEGKLVNFPPTERCAIKR